MSLTDSISGRRQNKNSKSGSDNAQRLFDDHHDNSVPYFYDVLADSERRLPKLQNNASFYDGQTHINIGRAGVTDLGNALDPDFNLVWKHPIFGDFLSISSFQQFIMGDVQDHRVRMMTTRTIREIFDAPGAVALSVPENFEALVVDAMWERIRYLSGLKEMLINSTLPFAMYRHNRNNGPKHAQFAEWMVPALEIIRYALQEGKRPDLSGFVRDPDIPSHSILTSRPGIGSNQRSSGDLRKNLLGDNHPAVRKQEPKKQKPPKKVETDPVAEVRPDEAVLPKIPRKSKEEVYLESIKGAELWDTVNFDNRQTAMAFIMVVTKAQLNDEELDLDYATQPGYRNPQTIPAGATDVARVHIFKVGDEFMFRMGSATMESPFDPEEEPQSAVVSEDATDKEIKAYLGIPGARRVSGQSVPPKKGPAKHRSEEGLKTAAGIHLDLESDSFLKSAAILNAAGDTTEPIDIRPDLMEQFMKDMARNNSTSHGLLSDDVMPTFNLDRGYRVAPEVIDGLTSEDIVHQCETFMTDMVKNPAYESLTQNVYPPDHDNKLVEIMNAISVKEAGAISKVTEDNDFQKKEGIPRVHVVSSRGNAWRSVAFTIIDQEEELVNNHQGIPAPPAVSSDVPEDTGAIWDLDPEAPRADSVTDASATLPTSRE